MLLKVTSPKQTAILMVLHGLVFFLQSYDIFYFLQMICMFFLLQYS